MATNYHQNRRPLPPENTPSLLLSREENDVVFSLLGKKCTTLSTSVVQLLLTEAPHHAKWQIRCTGVVCFVKDNPKRSYFIRVYDFDRQQLVWEQELYNTFQYNTPREFFHTFEAHDCMAGLNFANDREAKQFKDAIHGKLNERQRRQEKRLQNSQQHNTPQPTLTGVTVPAATANRSQSLSSLQSQPKKGKKDKKKDRKLTKDQIGAPSNFQHIQHIGWNPSTGFDLENVDPKLRRFFQEAGISEEQLKDRDTRDFIYDFLEQNGGIQAALQEVKSVPPIPSVPPIASMPPQQPKHHNNQRNHPPQHSGHNVSDSPSIPTHAPPPPPSSSSYLHSRSPHKPYAPSIPIPSMPISAPPPPPPPMAASPPMPSSAPPPPPPPPPMPFTGAPVPPPPPPMSGPPMPPAASLPPVTDSRSALMEQIRRGNQLKHVEADSDSNKSNTSNSDDPRNALLNQIKQGVGLRPVDDRPLKPLPKSTDEAGGLKEALMRAMNERNRAINHTDESDGDSGGASDGDEWDD